MLQTTEACEVLPEREQATGVSPPSKDEEAQDGTCRLCHRLEAALTAIVENDRDQKTGMAMES